MLFRQDPRGVWPVTTSKTANSEEAALDAFNDAKKLATEEPRGLPPLERDPEETPAYCPGSPTYVNEFDDV
jgi:hypothetical protein